MASRSYFTQMYLATRADTKLTSLIYFSSLARLRAVLLEHRCVTTRQVWKEGQLSNLVFLNARCVHGIFPPNQNPRKTAAKRETISDMAPLLKLSVLSLTYIPHTHPHILHTTRHENLRGSKELCFFLSHHNIQISVQLGIFEALFSARRWHRVKRPAD